MMRGHSRPISGSTSRNTAKPIRRMTAIAAIMRKMVCSSPATSRVRGSVDYAIARATWSSRHADIGALVPAVLRPTSEHIHDITTSVHTHIPETATRFYVVYRINNAFSRSIDSAPGIDARFDVQVNQALPFGVAGTKWEVLVGLRNLFRDPVSPASVYDELLVVRPPKRVVGGFLVRF